MKTPIYFALAALFAMPAVAQDGPPRGPMPPAVLSQMNLGGAGLLPLFYADNQFGLTQARNGESRGRIGDAAGFVIVPDTYRHSSRSVTLPVTLRYGLKDGKSFVTVKGVLNTKNEDPNLTSADSELTSLTVGYQYFFSPTGMIAASIGKNTFSSEAKAVNVDRDSIDLRVDYVQKLSDHWGFAGRVISSTGDSTLTIKGPGITATQSDDYVYTQAELAGHYTTQDLSFIPAGFALRPLVGVSYQDGNLSDTRNSFGGPVTGGDEDSGSVWAKATLAEMAPPGKWAPFGTLGIEHVYQDSNSAFIDEDTYAVMGLGVTYQSKGGMSLSVSYDGRHGFNDNRDYNSFVGAAVFTF